jgi:tetratricopeptide (TPR) repeat protein
MPQWTIALILFLHSCIWAEGPTPTSSSRRNGVTTQDVKLVDISAAESAESRQDFDKVIELLSSKTADLSRKGLFILARAYRAKGRYLEEQRVLALRVSRDPKDYVALTHLGVALGKLNKHKEASQKLRQALQLKSNYKEAHLALLALARQKNNRYEIRAILEEALTALGEDAWILNELCAAYYQDVFLEKAVQACRAAIEKSPTHPENHVYLGLAHIDQKEKDLGRKILTKAAKQFPNSAFSQCSAGDFLRTDENWTGAAEYYEKGVIADAKNVKCQLGMAETNFELENYNRSLSAYQAACALDRKKVLPMIKKATGRLRKAEKFDWREKFEGLASRC